MSRKVVLTGMRTTGALHLGHFVGALKQWKEIQDSREYECYFLLADVQALTTHADRPELLTQSIQDVVLDWLSVGLNPTLPTVHFVQQSQVLERHELSIYLGMVAKYSEVLRDPTLKAELAGMDSATMGFVYYPVDQAADIYMVCPTPPESGDELLVPVGQDQEAHLELAREIARDFNRMYGPTFVPCTGLIGEIGRLVGTDGETKMSKSKDNAIFLSDSKEDVIQKVRLMRSYPIGGSPRMRKTDPGVVEGNPLFDYFRAFSADGEGLADLEERYLQGGVGDSEVKVMLSSVINNFLDPLRERRASLRQSDVREMVISGSQAARAACVPVIERVRELMRLQYPVSG